MCEWYLQNLAQLVSLQHLDSVTTYSTLTPSSSCFSETREQTGPHPDSAANVRRPCPQPNKTTLVDLSPQNVHEDSGARWSSIVAVQVHPGVPQTNQKIKKI